MTPDWYGAHTLRTSRTRTVSVALELNPTAATSPTVHLWFRNTRSGAGPSRRHARATATLDHRGIHLPTSATTELPDLDATAVRDHLSVLDTVADLLTASLPAAHAAAQHQARRDSHRARQLLVHASPQRERILPTAVVIGHLPGPDPATPEQLAASHVGHVTALLIGALRLPDPATRQLAFAVLATGWVDTLPELLEVLTAATSQ